MPTKCTLQTSTAADRLHLLMYAAGYITFHTSSDADVQGTFFCTLHTPMALLCYLVLVRPLPLLCYLCDPLAGLDKHILSSANAAIRQHVRACPRLTPTTCTGCD